MAPRAPPGVQAQTCILWLADRSPSTLTPAPALCTTRPLCQARRCFSALCDLRAVCAPPSEPQLGCVPRFLGSSGSGLRGRLGHKFLSHQDQVRAVLAPGRPVPSWAGQRVPPLWVPSTVSEPCFLCASPQPRGGGGSSLWRCRGVRRGLGCDAWIFTVCEAFHTLNPDLES